MRVPVTAEAEAGEDGEITEFETSEARQIISTREIFMSLSDLFCAPTGGVRIYRQSNHCEIFCR